MRFPRRLSWLQLQIRSRAHNVLGLLAFLVAGYPESKSSTHAKVKLRTDREQERAKTIACQAEVWAIPEMQGTEAVLKRVVAK